MDKLLEIGAWRQFALSLSPSILFVGSIAFLFGLYKNVPNDGADLWMAAGAFVLFVSVSSVLFEEIAGRFESRVDSRIYPRARARRKLWKTMSPLRKVNPDVYMHWFNTVWDRYLDIVPPEARPIRWDYYNSMVHRYRVVMTIGISLAVSSLAWMGSSLFAVPAADAEPILSSRAVGLVGVGIGMLSVYLLAYEVPSSAWVLHWHRVRLTRTMRANRTAGEGVAARRPVQGLVGSGVNTRARAQTALLSRSSDGLR